MAKDQTKRKSISKRIRFEVFKRDSFKCQYCGATAPDVLLHIDHIQPIAQSGDNDITNLITACISCNEGKGSVPLSDSSTLAKQRSQIEELQERREQLEMMMKWKRGLRSIKEDAVDEIAAYWQEFTPGWHVNQNGKNNIKKWLHRFALDEITHAMDIAADSYLKFRSDGKVTQESFETAFLKVPSICRVEKASKDDPELKDLYYIRGIARKNCTNYFDNADALEWLKVARSWDVSLEELRRIAYNVNSWTKFRNLVSSAIQRQKELQGHS
jgi:cytochrome c553